MGEVHIVVGIPSFNSARTIAHVVRAVAGGLAKYFPDRKSVIVNSDGGSTDGTHEAVMGADIDHDSLLLVSHRVPTIQRITTPYHGRGRGRSRGPRFGPMFHRGLRLPRVVVDSDL